jgi:hypothetical protein
MQPDPLPGGTEHRAVFSIVGRRDATTWSGVACWGQPLGLAKSSRRGWVLLYDILRASTLSSMQHGAVAEHHPCLSDGIS